MCPTDHFRKVRDEDEFPFCWRRGDFHLAMMAALELLALVLYSYGGY